MTSIFNDFLNESLFDKMNYGFHKYMKPMPRVTKLENGDYQISLVALGFSQEDLKIQIVGNKLKITGKLDGCISELIEISEINQSYKLDGISVDKVTAKLLNGILTVTIKQKDIEPDEKIEITIS